MLSKTYTPTFETKWYEYWLANNYFMSKPDPDKKPFTIVIPPPNCTGSLHIGHALNDTYQDITIRFKKLQGYNTLWIPGTDHGGIATQSVMERKLLEKDIMKEDVGREKFVSMTQEFKEVQRKTIISQLQRLGCAADWSRERFTMDDYLSSWVSRVFIHLYDKGLIYRNNYIINWCTHCKTAISDDEVEHAECISSLYYVKYYINESEYVVIATTRPETILGDSAVAYNPQDDRYEPKQVRVPIVNRVVDMIPDQYVKINFGTGLVKITPAHDKNDYEVGLRHNLPIYKIIDEQGRIMNTDTRYDGMDRFECREEIVKELQERNLIEKIESYKNSVGSCYRCHTIIEPYLSDQWFVSMEQLTERIMENQDIEVIPLHQKKVLHNWLSKKVDWCISRQLWWGHQLPIWYCDDCKNIICKLDKPEKCDKCECRNLTRETDVLDTWFSSALWPFAVFESIDYEYYFPTSVLITGSDILFFWVARMMMMSYEICGTYHFKQVVLHGVIRDKAGQKMSKTKGNGIDPLDVIETHSADILRFTLTMLTPKGQDAKISMKSFNLGKKFCTKLWNTVRYITLTIKVKIDEEIENPTLIDRWAIDKLNKTKNIVTTCVEKYDYAEALKKLYTFVWDEFCSIYIEYTKPYIQNRVTQTILVIIVDTILKLLHPFIPFITEELWQYIKYHTNDELNSIMDAEWPKPIRIETYNKKYDEMFAIFTKIVSQLNTIRSEFTCKWRYILDVTIGSEDLELLDYIKKNEETLKHMANSNINYNKIDPYEKYIVYTIETLTLHIKVDDGLNIAHTIKNLTKKLDHHLNKQVTIQKNIEAEKNMSPNRKIKLEGIVDNYEVMINKIRSDIDELKLFI